MSTGRHLDVPFRTAARQICEAAHPDDIIDACKALVHKDYATADEPVHQAISLAVLPRLLEILSHPPKQLSIDSENWSVFWALRALGSVIPERHEREAVRRGAAGIIARLLDRSHPETLCVAMKALAIVSAGFSTESDDKDGSTDEECLTDLQLQEDFETAMGRVYAIADEESQVRRATRHPFVLPLAAYALAFLLANAPDSAEQLDYSRYCGLLSELVETGERDCAEAVLVACEALVKRGGNARNAALDSGFLGRVLWRIGRGEYSGDLSPTAFGLVETVCGDLDTKFLANNHGMAAVVRTLGDLRSPEQQQAALTIASKLLEAPAVTDPAPDPGRWNQRE